MENAYDGGVRSVIKSARESKKVLKGLRNEKLRKNPKDSVKIDIPKKEIGCMTLFKLGAAASGIMRDMSTMTLAELQLLAKCVDHPHDHCGCPSRSSATNCLRIANHTITDQMAALLVEPSQQSRVNFNQFIANIHAGDSYLNVSNIETSFRELLEASHPSTLGIYDRAEMPEYGSNNTIKLVKNKTYPAIHASTIASIMMAGGRGAAVRKQREELDTLSTKCLTIINDLDSTATVECAAVANFIHAYFSDDPLATIHILNDGNASVKQFMQYKLAVPPETSGFIQHLTSQVYMDSATTSDIFHTGIALPQNTTHVYDWYTFTEANRRAGRRNRVADITVETGAANSGIIPITVTCKLNNFTPPHTISETITNSAKYSNGPTLDYIARLTDEISAIKVKPLNLTAIIQRTSQHGVWPMKDLLNQFVAAYSNKGWEKTRQDLLDFISDWKTFGDGEISRQARQLEPVIGRTLVISLDQNSSTCMRLLGQDGVYSHAQTHDMFREMGTPIEKAGAKEIARLNVLIGIYEHFVTMLRSLVFSDTVRSRMRAELGGLLERFDTVGVTSAGKFAWALKMADVYTFMSETIASLDYYHSLFTSGADTHYSTVLTSLGAFEGYISSIKVDIEGAGRYTTMTLRELNAPANAIRIPQTIINILQPGSLETDGRGIVLIQLNDMFEEFIGRNIAPLTGSLEKAHTDLMSFGRIMRFYSADHMTFVNNLIYSYDFTNPSNGFGVVMGDFAALDATYMIARKLMRNAPDRFFAKNNKFVDLPAAELTLTNKHTKYISIYEFTSMLYALQRSFKSSSYTAVRDSHVVNLYNELNEEISRLGSGDALVGKVDDIFEKYAKIIKNKIITTHGATGGGSSRSSRSTATQNERSGIINVLKLLTELHLAADDVKQILEIKSVELPAYVYSPPSNNAIRSSDYYKKYIAQRGPEVAAFAEKLYDTYTKSYSAHILIDTLDIDTLDALYSLENGGLVAAATPIAPITPAEIKSEIKKAEEHIASLKTQLVHQTRRQRQSRQSRQKQQQQQQRQQRQQAQPSAFQPILTAIREESAILSRSPQKSPEKAEGLWEKLGDMLKKGASPTRAESAQLKPMLKSAVRSHMVNPHTAKTIRSQLLSGRSETRRKRSTNSVRERY